MMRLFLSYSHQDEDLRKELEKHLAALRRDGVIDIWQDRRIGPGDEFDREISNQRESADIMLLLVSSDFLHSHYRYDIEMKWALEHHAEGYARVSSLSSSALVTGRKLYSDDSTPPPQTGLHDRITLHALISS
jgi:hypothetical protein